MTSEEAGLFLLALVEVPQVMSAFLPSPTTAHQGGGDPERIRSLQTDMVLGSIVSLAAAYAITRIMGDWRPFIGASVILALFLIRYNHALSKAKTKANTGY